ncbi:DUF2163 domain-containing protein [Fodinicurvata halophila]|uniref:DUF2163 domain-containing protein n=2 Tax=Fodinicurvata halophila TaxID=1419723 RepID=A0ABV8URB0_9PROT
MSYLMSLPAAERYGQIMRFAPDYWQTDFNLLTSASLVSAGDDSLVFRAVYRRNLDLAGAHWASEDTAGHLLHRYEAQPSYRGCSLRFRYRANPETLGLDAFNGPALALETHGGPIHHLRLWNHRVLPNPNAADDDPYDQVIEVVFDDHLYSGFSPPDANDPEAVRAARVPVDDIKRVLLTLPPRSYMAGRTSLAAPLASGDSQVSLAVPSGLTISPGDRLVFPAQRAPGPDAYRVTSTTSGPQQTVSFEPAAVLTDSMAAGQEVRVTVETQQRLPQAETVEVHLEELTCTGPGALLAINDQGCAPHGLAMADGYDNAYHLTPARVVAQAVKLGYRDDWVLYLGISHFHNLSWDEGAGRFQVDPDQASLNPPAAAWLADLCARLQAAGFRLWLSLSFEILADFMPADWAQKDHAGRMALTGWQPPSSLISPCNAAALDWLGGVAEATLGLAVDAGLAPCLQIGEPWWWDGSFGTQVPHIYDAFTLNAYHAETGLYAPTPWLQRVEGPAEVHGPYLDWCRERLGAATDALRDRVRAAYPAVQVALLLFTPQVFRPDSEILTRLNFPAAAWAWPAYDVLQVEDYDWVVAGDFARTAETWRIAQEVLGYPLSAIHYFAGFVLLGEEAWRWRAIDRALAEALARGPARVFVWSREQVVRDGFVYDPEVSWPGEGAALTRLALAWRVERRDGRVQGFTTHDRPLTIAGESYRPAVSFEPSEIRATGRLTGDSLEAWGGFHSEEIAEADLRAGLYDGARVRILQVDWQDPEGTAPLVLAEGHIGEIEPRDHHFRAELRGPAQRLNQPLGDVYQPHCRADLGDARCGVDLAALALEGEVTALGAGGPGGLAADQVLACDIQVAAPEAWRGGLVEFLDGRHAGRSLEVKELRADSGRLVLFEPLGRPPDIGDRIRLTPGCDKAAATCRQRFDNLVNFRGEPSLPGSDAVLRPVTRLSRA